MPLMAEGKALVSPGSGVGAELQLEQMCYADGKVYWSTEPRTFAELEGQRQSGWCWVTVARMFAKHYYYDFEFSQALAVSEVQVDGDNLGGDAEDIIEAIEFFTIHMPDNDLRFTYRKGVGDNPNPGILSEEALVRVLDAGHVVAIERSHWAEDGRRVTHSSLITGYTTEYASNQGEYMFIMFDPWPDGVTEIWQGEQDTDGQRYMASYDWICSGRDTPDSELEHIWYWQGFVVAAPNLIHNEDILVPVYTQ